MEAHVQYYAVAGLVFALRGERLCHAVQALPELLPFALNGGGEGAREAAFGIDEGSAYFQEKKGTMRRPDLRLALWRTYGVEALPFQRMALHASAVVCAGKAYLFLGESGTGKSTHTRLWLAHIPGSRLLNDDSPVVQIVPQGEVLAWGSPWSGKTPCYVNEAYPLGGLVHLVQAPHNAIRRLSGLEALAVLHPSAPPDFARGLMYDRLAEFFSVLLQRVPVYQLSCRPQAQAARLAYQTLVGLRALRRHCTRPLRELSR